MENTDDPSTADSALDKENIAKAADLLANLPPGYKLPDAFVEVFVERNTLRYRIALVPAHRHENFLGRIQGSYSTYILLGSGSSQTDSLGQANIDVDDLLRAVRGGRPMHKGVHPRPDGSLGGRDDVVPYDVLITGVPVTVVTGTGDLPTLFTTRNQEVANYDGRGMTLASWYEPAPRSGKSAGSILVKSFAADGTVRGNETFDWQTSIEVVFGQAAIY